MASTVLLEIEMDTNTNYSGNFPVAPGSYRGRVRTGCLTCRSRKVKCDEQRPSCYNCTKVRRSCVYKSTTGRRSPLKPAVAVSETQAMDPSLDKTISAIDTFSQHNLNADQLFYDQMFFLDETDHFNAVNDLSTVGDTITPQGVFQPSSAAAPFSIPHQNSLPGRVNDLENLEVSFETSPLRSEDNHLTTSPDVPAANELPSRSPFSPFIEFAEAPFISPCDHINWERMKIYITELGTYDEVVAASILAVQALYVAQIDGLPTTNAMSLYHSVKSLYGKMLDDNSQDFNNILIVTFLLCLFEAVTSHETIPITSQSNGAFVRRLEIWSVQENPPAVSLRIESWLRILHAAAMHSGGRGLLSEKVNSLLHNSTQETPSLNFLDNYSNITTSLYEIISGPLFEFYLELQKISSQISNMTCYNRPRGDMGDEEEEVLQVCTNLRARMSLLWQNRTSVLRFEPHELRTHLSSAVADPIIALVGICIAEYYTELVALGRTLGQTTLASPEAKQAMYHIRKIIDGDWNASSGGKINSGYLRPLFLFAIESMDREDTQWAVEKLRLIKNPIRHSDFIASLANGVTEEQIRKGRRISVKFFCSRKFGISQPYI